jgi:mannose-6-phosphate isomerase-like protein (cupin superfamily)
LPVKFKGPFIWHRHADTDEVSITLEGKMFIEFRDAKVELKTGDLRESDTRF